jgi:hypothetical protein
MCARAFAAGEGGTFAIGATFDRVMSEAPQLTPGFTFSDSPELVALQVLPPAPAGTDDGLSGGSGGGLGARGLDGRLRQKVH